VLYSVQSGSVTTELVGKSPKEVALLFVEQNDSPLSKVLSVRSVKDGQNWFFWVASLQDEVSKNPLISVLF